MDDRHNVALTFGRNYNFSIFYIFFFFFFLDKPKRPPPPTRPPTGPHIQKAASPNVEEDYDEFKLDEGDDPFDTAYVERIIPKSVDYDEDFDPRAADEEEEQQLKGETNISVVEEVDLFATPNIETAPKVDSNQLTVLKKDFLSGSTSDLSNLSDVAEPIAPSAQDEESFVDPFDTSAVDNIVAPGKAELKFLEKEFLESDLRKSLSDPDFDPRADEDEEILHKPPEIDLNQRKASLSLNIHSGVPKVVKFVSPDLLHVDSETSGKIQKPLTPYYNRDSLLSNEPAEEDEDEQEVDPFDTSFVPQIAPTKVELDLLEQEILKEPTPTLKHSLSDPDFDPRAITPISVAPSVAPIVVESKPSETDLFLAVDDHNIKVLTPAKDNYSSNQPLEDIDPFDTSIAANIKPGSAELKLLEDEFIEKKVEKVPDIASLDILSDTQDNSLYIKLLTPQKSGSLDIDQQDDFDPFDTSFAANIAPGQAEIKLLESELIN